MKWLSVRGVSRIRCTAILPAKLADRPSVRSNQLKRCPRERVLKAGDLPNISLSASQGFRLRRTVGIPQPMIVEALHEQLRRVIVHAPKGDEERMCSLCQERSLKADSPLRLHDRPQCGLAPAKYD